MSLFNPDSPQDWCQVKNDSERLLKVWRASEGVGQNTAVNEVSEQLLDLLQELSTVTPVLVVSDRIVHIHSDEFPYEEEEEEETLSTPPKVNRVLMPELVDQPTVIVMKEEEEEAEEEEEEEEAEEEEEEVEEEEEEEVEEEEEEVEEEEEEEEEGMEVEQVFIRGRTYWLESKTNKLFLNAAGDEVGDEIGEMVDGKPRFLATK